MNEHETFKLIAGAICALLAIKLMKYDGLMTLIAVVACCTILGGC